MSWPPAGVLAGKHKKPVGPVGRGGNGVHSRQAKGGGGRILLERAALSVPGMEEDFMADGRAAFCVLKLGCEESTGEFVCCSIHKASREMWNGENAALYL